MRTSRINFGAVVCLIGMLMLILSAAFIPIKTVGAVDNCSVTIECIANKTAVSGAEWSAYRISSRNPYGGFTLEGNFAKYPITLDDMSSTAVAEAAYTLETYALTDNLKPDKKGKTDLLGSITFSGLGEGIYLLFSDNFESADYKYETQPLIIELGGYEADSVTVKPKITVTPKPKPEKQTYSIRKIWINEPSETIRPTSISVELYKDGRFDRAVTLNSSNGWYYEWKSDKTSSWRVVEKSIPADYTVSYSVGGTEFLIKNTYNAPEPTTETTTQPETTDTYTEPTDVVPTEATTVPITTLPPREELDRTIKYYENLNEHDYTPESWKEYLEVLKRAKLILGNSESTDEEILAVLEELRLARKKLILGYLPQTGQLWWPVPVLAGGGLLMIAVGVRLNKKKGNKDDNK